MSRPKLKNYDYYNFQMPEGQKPRLQQEAKEQGQTLSSLLMTCVEARDLLRSAAQAGRAVKLWLDEDRVVVADNGHMVKI
jgi:hypothetical protein